MTDERPDTTAVAAGAPPAEPAAGTPAEPAETERNLPATTGTTALATTGPEPAAPRWRRPVSVAFLPLAVATLLVIAFAMALWTFLATTS